MSDIVIGMARSKGRPAIPDHIVTRIRELGVNESNTYAMIQPAIKSETGLTVSISKIGGIISPPKPKV